MKNIERAIKRLNNDMTKMSDMYEENIRIKDDLCIAIDCMEKELKRQENKPLTLSELKEMEGEPVWCEFNSEHYITIEKIIITDMMKEVIFYKNMENEEFWIPIADRKFYKHKPTEE